MFSRSEFEKETLIHLNSVYRAAFALCGGGDVVDDLVQTTFLKAFEKFGSFRQGTNCRAWLLSILRNSWIDHLRHVKVVGTQLPLTEELVEQEPKNEIVWSDAGDLLENFSDEQVIKALNRLPDDQRLALFLFDVEDLSQQEIAEITDVAVGTVKSRVSRARVALRESLGNYAKEIGLIGGER